MNVKFQQSQLMDEHNKYSVASTAMAGSKISKLQDTGTLYLNKIKQESERLRLLEEEIVKNENILKNKRQQIIRQKGDTDRSQQKDQDPELIKKKIKQIQVNLNKNRQKHNETLAHNTQLRSEINSLRREKNIFSQIQSNLQLELQQKSIEQKAMKDKCIKSQEDFKAIKQMLENTKHRTFKEQKEFEKEFQNVFRILDLENRDEKLKDIKQEANRKKNNNDSLLFASKYMGDTYVTQQEVGLNQSGLMQSQVGFKGNKGGPQQGKQSVQNKNMGGVSTKDATCLEGIRSEVQQYQHTFAQLQQETGKDTIQEIVEKFVEQEEHNFSLFTFINTQSDEVYSYFFILFISWRIWKGLKTI